MRVDVRANDERDEVEKRHPSLRRKERLREGQRDRGCEPADAHDGPEAGADGRAHLVPGSSAGDPGHACEVDGVLDGCDLIGVISILQCSRGFKHIREDCL
jgi:hypothetical protein